MKSVAGLLLAAALTASAGAQCNLYLNGVPDFDQRRNTLPNNGAMYCVPTSAINLMAYVSNHGAPFAMGGARDWQSQINYAFVTSRLSSMGSLMGTHPFDGTGGEEARFGFQQYLNQYVPGMFTLTYHYGDFSVLPLAAHLGAGHFVNICYGYYPVTNGQYYRDGGHCVTLTGIEDYCETESRLRWRDPANDSDNLSTQSTFANKFSDTSEQTFIATDGAPRTRLRLWDLGVDSTTRRYVDTYFTVNPLVALTGGVTHTNFLFIQRPVQIPGFTPPSGQAEAPGNSPIAQIVMGAQQMDAFVVTSRLFPRLVKVFKYDMETSGMQELFSSNATMRIVTSRHGDLFVYGDGSVRKYDVSGRTPVMEQQVTPPSPVQAMAYDDARDELVVVTDGRRLIRYPQDLSGEAIDEPLPTAVLADGSVSIAIDQDLQKYYICGSTSRTIFVVRLFAGSPRLQVETSFLLPAVQSPQELQFTDEGTLLLLNDGVIAEFFRSAAAGWMPRQDSILAGLPGAGGLCVARSRTNFIHGVHDTRDWRNVTLDEGVQDVPDCDADFNQDTFVNSQDFFDFLTAFFGQDRTADFNSDGTINSQDFFDFLRAFFEGC